MGIPQVVIVGRPNVGKSSLFNWLVGKRLAIVDHTAGVTRDRLTHLMCVENRYFELVDTGGMGIEDVDNLTADIEQQIETAIESADVMLFVVDTRDGLVPLDQAVAKRLRYVDVPILCVANKTDAFSIDAQADEFYRLGRGKLVRASAKENRGRQELLDLILERLPPDDALAAPPEDGAMKVAIVGRRNTGKSTFVNTLAKAERMIVSEVPGTTRDSVDVRFELDGKAFVAIDTPGLRRTKSITTDIDFYSMHRAQRSIRRADVVLLFFDASQQYQQGRQAAWRTTLPSSTSPASSSSTSGTCWPTQCRPRNGSHICTIRFAPCGTCRSPSSRGRAGKNVKALLNHAQMLFKQSLDACRPPN